MIRKPELIAPAGNLEKLKFAYAYGADSCYAGFNRYNLRAGAGNFTLAELGEAVRLARLLGKGLYLALNIFFRERDFKGAGRVLERLLKLGLKDIILSDPGLIYFINRSFQGLFRMTLSTQANTTNSRAVDQARELGVRRVILARELSLGEIRQIRKNTDVELECFIHGAMCVSYSGRCLLSEYFTGRNANRGDCSHPCRWSYELAETKRPSEKLTMEQSVSGTALLASRDLEGLPLLRPIIRAGVDALKIEGRMKGIYYAANVSRVYRRAIDRIVAGKAFDRKKMRGELDAVNHRPYFTGFYMKNRSTVDHGAGQIRKYQFIGYFKKRLREGLYPLVLKGTLDGKDPIEIIRPDFCDRNNVKFRLYDERFRRVKRGVITGRFYMETGEEIHPFAIIRKRLRSVS